MEEFLQWLNLGVVLFVLGAGFWFGFVAGYGFGYTGRPFWKNEGEGGEEAPLWPDVPDSPAELFSDKYRTKTGV